MHYGQLENSELDGLFKAELNVPAKNYPIYFKFGQLSKINKKKK